LEWGSGEEEWRDAILASRHFSLLGYSIFVSVRVVNDILVSAGKLTSFFPVAAAPAVPAPAPTPAPMAAPLPPPASPPISAPAPAPPPMATVSRVAFEPMVRPCRFVLTAWL